MGKIFVNTVNFLETYLLILSMEYCVDCFRFSACFDLIVCSRVLVGLRCMSSVRNMLNKLTMMLYMIIFIRIYIYVHGTQGDLNVYVSCMWIA